MFETNVQRRSIHQKQSKFSWRLLSTLALIAPVSLMASEDRMDYVAERLESAIKHEFIGAAVVGSYDSGEIQYMNFGLASKDPQEAPSEATLFEVGSITKVFTAALTQVLIDSGALSWDSTVKSSLEDWQITSAKIRNITLRELATHSSGLPRMPLNWEAKDPLDPYLGYDTKLLQQFIGQIDPPQLRKQPAYSNLGFGLLGTIAANAAGKSYSSALKELVFEPLGMHQTTVGITSDMNSKLAQGFGQGAQIPNWNFDALAGAGAVLSSAEDMVQFIKRNVEEDDSSAFKSLSQLQEVQVQPNQAFAWVVDKNESGQPVFWHAGLTGGYASFVAISPEESKGWVLLTTSMQGGLVNEIGRSFFAPIPRMEIVDLSAYLGVYRIIQDMYMTFSERENQLIAQATGQAEIPLTFVKDREFKFDPADIVLSFEKPRDGISRSVNMNQRGQFLKGRRVEDRYGIPKREEVEIDEETLNEYPGFYRLAPKAVFTVVIREGQLFSLITGQPIVPLFPMGEDRFFYKHVDAEVRFERDKEGKVSGLTLFQNGQHKAPKTDSDEIAVTPPRQNRPNMPRSPRQSGPPRR